MFAATAVTLTLLLLTATANAALTSRDALRWKFTRSWLHGALCIHQHESTDWHIYNAPYANGMQFMLSTWVSAGGRASWWVWASPREQLYRAWIVYRRDGFSWSEWPNTSRACGLR